MSIQSLAPDSSSQPSDLSLLPLTTKPEPALSLVHSTFVIILASKLTGNNVKVLLNLNSKLLASKKHSVDKLFHKSVRINYEAIQYFGQIEIR